MEAQMALIAAFRSAAFLGLVSHLPLDNNRKIKNYMGFRSGEFASQSSTVIPGSLIKVGISIKLVSRRKHEVP